MVDGAAAQRRDYLASVRADERRRKVPQQKPGRSEQTVATPRNFLDAVEVRFGKLVWDLAATKENGVVRGRSLHRFGPDHIETGKRDALINDWTKLKGNLWLNPPYSDIAPWAKKCVSRSGEQARAAPIFLLVPASVGSNWFADYVFERALVFFLSPRLVFVGHTQVYPKDLILACYGYKPEFRLWRWRP